MTRDGDVLVLDGTDMRLSAAVVSEQAFSTHASVQLDVHFEIGPGRTIVESCVGIGASVEEAIANAELSFASNALHVLLAAFAGGETDQVTVEEWECGGVPFRVVLGHMTGRGAPPKGGSPTSWFATVEAAMRAAALSPRTHWLRVYCARTGGPQQITEVLLDNEEWPSLAAELAALPWPATDGFYSVRIFMVLDPGFDTTRAIAAMHRLRDRPDDEIVHALVTEGAHPSHAEQLVDFLPIAFGRPVLERIGVRVPDVAVLVAPEGERTFRLEDDPVFADAVALAREAYRTGSIPGEVFRSLAMRGAELSAVNQALAAGARAEDLVLSPPRFTARAAVS